MIGASKILTVSYGTFSCTLEGFDEPFSTMKAIAEYFRDLAADDRYFGAEPPTPDAEMLHRIAEREIQRRVEAKINENGVVLRQTDRVTPHAAPVEAAPVEAAPVAAAAADSAKTAHADAAAQLAPSLTSEARAEVDFNLAALAAQPLVDPSMVEEETLADGPARMSDVEDEFAADHGLVGDAIIDEVPESGKRPDVVADQDALPEVLDAQGLDAIMAEVANADLSEFAEDEDERDYEPFVPLTRATEEKSEPESIAAKLMRIRAVVQGVRSGPADLYEEEDAPKLEAIDENIGDDFGFELDMDDGVPELRAAEAARANARQQEDSGPELAEVEIDEPEAVTDEAQAADETQAAVASGTVEDTAMDEETAMDGEILDEVQDTATDKTILTDGPVIIAQASELPDTELPDVVPQVDLSEDDDELRARILQMGVFGNDEAQDAEVVAAQSAESSDAGFLAAGQTPDNAAWDDLRVSVDDDGEADAFDADATPTEGGRNDTSPPSLYQRARARVIRISKTAAHASRAETEAVSPASTEEIPSPEAVTNERRAMLGSSHADDDGDVSRLMDEAKAKLEGTENRRKFSAISHLKAAVAATLADRKMHSSDSASDAPSAEEEEISLYRDDLSKVVRPRSQPGDAAEASPAPAFHSAPLVLVSEQRVDHPSIAENDGISVRPRRIASGNLAYSADEDEEDDFDEMTDFSPESVSSFAEFAEKLGAVTLTELLEAAAAYTASVEGQSFFSRPQILRKVAIVTDERDFSREDGLRSFGTLLREGKIQKISRGQFTIADNSKFMAEARRAN